MSDRAKKLAELKSRESIKKMQITSDGESFIELLEATVNELKDTLNLGVEFNNLDELIEQLGQIKILVEPIESLRKQIAEMEIPEIPESVEIKGLDEFRSMLKEATKQKDVKIEWPTDNFKAIIKSLNEIKDVSSKVAVSNQSPTDFIPVRRVIKIANQFFYDDAPGGGGGSGGAFAAGVQDALITTIGGNQVVRMDLGTLLSMEDQSNSLSMTLMKPVASSTYAPSAYINAGTVTKANIKSSPGNVYTIRVTNANAAVRYFQLHNKSSAPAGGDTAQLYWLIPAGTATNPGIVQLDTSYFSPSEYFSTGIGFAISTTATTFTDSATAADHITHVRSV